MAKKRLLMNEGKITTTVRVKPETHKFLEFMKLKYGLSTGACVDTLLLELIDIKSARKEFKKNMDNSEK
jgi:hypothetical protein